MRKTQFSTHKARRALFGSRRYDDAITRLRLKQAFGRLIRRATDRGVFVLLDPMMPSRLRGAFPVFYDESGAIGRRYRRQDEVGTPFCVTVDGQTKEDQTVTLRERDSMRQERVSLDKVLPYIKEQLDR